jgi:phage shock protein A
MIREMEDTLVEIKAACAGAMASQKKAERDVEWSARQSERWSSRAELAIDRGREELARKALRTKRQYEDDFEATRADCEKLAGLVAEYRSDIVQIEDKLGMARERQRVLVQRHIHAVQKERAQRDLRRFDSSGAIVRFEEFANRVDRADAEAELVNYGRPKSLEQEFSEIERDESIEDELRALKEKRQLAMTPPALA